VKRILIFDHDTSIRELLQVSFEALRPAYEVIAAANGLIALDHLYHHRFDLVITDYQMPQMNGLDLIDNLRQQWPETQVISMTGHHSRNWRLGLDLWGWPVTFANPSLPDML
jgi:CheY-like chemotaxis protein